MKKTKKRFLGLLGLFAVAVMTVIAVIMPSPSAMATTLTDTIKLRVVGDTPAVNISSDFDNQIISFPNYTLTISYENATKVTLYSTHFDGDGNHGDKVAFAIYDDLDYVAGDIKDAIFTVDEYGKYIISADAVGYDGAMTAPEDYIVFWYLPVIASLNVNQVTGKYEVKVDSYGGDVNEIDFYLEDEFLRTLNKGEFDEIVDFSMAGKPSGTYTVKVIAKNSDGQTLYIPLILSFEYSSSEVPDAGAPDTGSFFQSLNITKEDYLITALMVFFLLSIAAFGFVMKGRKSSLKKKR